jgi:hypothetical protein
VNNKKANKDLGGGGNDMFEGTISALTSGQENNKTLMRIIGTLLG